MDGAQLIETQGQLQVHFERASNAIGEVINAMPQSRLSADWTRSPLVAGLSGPSCEFIRRNRGASVAVVPLLPLQQGLWAWLGYREEWDEERQVRSTRRFSFRSSSITVHFGFRNDVYKPQVFRAEWSGWARWTGNVLGFQASGAGHPHWQIDVLESLADNAESERAQQLLRVLNSDDSEGRDFAQMTIEDTRDLVSRQQLSRMHFPSAAAWWRSEPNDRHAHCPSKTVEVEGWLRRTICYVSAELTRMGAT